MSEFYDTHAHLDYPDFDQELPQVIERAAAAGITKIIGIATNPESSRRVLQIAERFPQVYAVIGCHPTEASEAPADARSLLRELAGHPKVVALGETGLDYHRLPSKADGNPSDNEAYRQRQKLLFQQHLEVAAELGLNCVVHERDAFEDTVKLLEPFAAKVRGVFHCFSNHADAMRRVIALGSIVSFTGILTFKNAAEVRATCSATPMDKFMLETDCPFLAPVPYRGKRCEPAYVRDIAEVAAKAKGCSLEELSVASCATAKAFFQRL